MGSSPRLPVRSVLPMFYSNKSLRLQYGHRTAQNVAMGRAVSMKPIKDSLQRLAPARNPNHPCPVGKWAIASLALLLMLEVAVLSGCSSQPSRSVLSGLTQLLIGATCALACIRAASRSDDAGRYCWRWMTLSFLIWTVAQSINLGVIVRYSQTWDRLVNLLFFFSVIPFAMLLLADADDEAKRFDPIQLLDFLQVFLNWLAVYLLFTPLASENSAFIDSFVWTRDIVYNGTVALAFLLRALGVRKERPFFCSMALFMILSGAADAYTDNPSIAIGPGSWFDLIWSLLLVIPILLAARWVTKRTRESNCRNKTECVASHAFPLVYPFATSLLVALIAPHSPVLACTLIGITFVGTAVRMLVIQNRLLDARRCLEFEATHDSLTGVWNHGAAIELLESEITRSLRNGLSAGILMIDLDHFKQVNDRYGHQVGDQVLQGVVARITAQLRDYDVIGRYGGEEFIVIVPECKPREILACAERLRRAIEETPIDTKNGPVFVTASFGASCVSPDPSVDLRSVVDRADAALYRAKENGRNCIDGEFGVPLDSECHSPQFQLPA